MIYPQFLNTNDTIGLTAPSNGITQEAKIKRLDFAIQNFNQLGFKIQETPNVRTSTKGASTTAQLRAQHLLQLYQDNEVKMIFCAAGGDFLMEILPYINFDIIKENPKWLQGYSDPTGLLFTITTNCDIATIYSNNFAAFGMQPWHESLNQNLEILKGNILKQNSFSKYESEHTEYKVGNEPYTLNKQVKWENARGEDYLSIKGRMIGGCIDILTELFGTRFDKTKEFIERYKEDGIIWYFDNCELSSEALIRTLWKFKDNGWFSHTTGIIFGRSATLTSYFDISFKEAILHSLEDLNIPIIINADIGHVSPRMTIINGAYATITCTKNKGTLTYTLK